MGVSLNEALGREHRSLRGRSVEVRCKKLPRFLTLPCHFPTIMASRDLTLIPASPMQGLTKDVKPSPLRKRRLADDDGYGAEIVERELHRCDVL